MSTALEDFGEPGRQENGGKRMVCWFFCPHSSAYFRDSIPSTSDLGRSACSVMGSGISARGTFWTVRGCF